MDPFFFRHDESTSLVANAKKAKKKLGWDPKVSFEELAVMMIRNDYDILTKQI